MKKVCIIGAGVAGMACGIHLQKSGFQTVIYECGSTPGGLCTGWSRGGYSFNGCMHWLLGAEKGSSFHTMWNEIVDLSQIEFVDHKERVQFEVKSHVEMHGRASDMTDKYGSNIFHFYNKTDDFEKYLLDIAPEDATLIKRWMSCVRGLNKFQEVLPPVIADDSSLWQKIKFWGVKMTVRMHQLGFHYLKYRFSGILQGTTHTFAERFKSPFLREAIKNLYEKEMPMNLLCFVQSYADLGVAKYPKGGSEAFAKLLADSYLKSGGTIKYNSKVEKIVVDDGAHKAKGIQLKNGDFCEADYVVSAADWHWTMFDALGEKYIPSDLMKYKKIENSDVYYSYCILYLGVKDGMKNHPHFLRFYTDPYLLPDGTPFDKMEVHIYNYDETLAGDDRCTIAVYFQTQNGDYWIDKRANDRGGYEDIKKKFTALAIEKLVAHFGEEFRDKIEVSDLTTPASYHRYTNNYNGSSQGWMPTIGRRSFGKVCGLSNVFLCGHWTIPGGGLPIALKSGRDVARKIKNNTC